MSAPSSTPFNVSANATEACQFLRDLYPHVLEVFGRDGWDDPAMDVYNDSACLTKET